MNYKDLSYKSFAFCGSTFSLKSFTCMKKSVEKMFFNWKETSFILVLLKTTTCRSVGIYFQRFEYGNYIHLVSLEKCSVIYLLYASHIDLKPSNSACENDIIPLHVLISFF